MPQVQISQVKDSGELSWGLSLVDDQRVSLIVSVTPTSKGVINATAKTLIHKGAHAPLIFDADEDSTRPFWVLEKISEDGLLRFTLVSETLFQIDTEFSKSDDIEAALKNVQSNLEKAEIKWIPTEADPAYEEKTTDLTPQVGVHGS